MATSFSGERCNCYICGKRLEKDDQSFLLQRAKVKHEWDDSIDIWKNGTAKFIAHASCQNEILWKSFNPGIELDKPYYAYITLGYKNNKKIWKLGNRIIKDKCTQQELNDLIALFAKDLLNGKVKGY